MTSRKLSLVVVCCFLVLGSMRCLGQSADEEYARVQARLAKGWNTWDTQSVTTHVLLPEGLAIRVGIENQATVNANAFLGMALIGRQGKGEERVVPGPHSWDGSYTDLTLNWHGRSVRIQSAHAGAELVLLVTPVASEKENHVPAEVVFSAGMLWNRAGRVEKSGERITATMAGRVVPIYLAGRDSRDAYVPVTGPYFSAELTGPVGLSTGTARSVKEIASLIEAAADKQRLASAKSERTQVEAAIETVLGWDTIYEPEGRRVISPVSRIWSVGWGGYVLFDWDTYFAATLAATGDRDLAYANAIEICREATEAGFVPNYARAGKWKSSDRSEPPVGAITVLGLYGKFHDRWLLEETYPALLKWNRWWAEHRDRDGYLVWGSDGENPHQNLDDGSAGTRAGAILESGLDNSPMYDEAQYDAKTHQLAIADVGLMSMVVADCDALAEMAEVLGKSADAAELKERAEKYRKKLATLWDPATGIFRNRDLVTGELSGHLSPTNFYPLMAKAATPEQASRMVGEHLLNPKEFWGDWVIPAIARNDGAFKDQDYWRGRIWGPMNYLVSLGLARYPQGDVADARKKLAAKSLELFLKEWKANGHVHENYNGMTGEGDDVGSSDRFYHWGALLGLIALEEEGEAR